MSLQGIHEIKDKVRPTDIELIRRDYAANGGWETFLAYEDPEKDVLVVSASRIMTLHTLTCCPQALLRLRKCSAAGTYRPELLSAGPTSIVRELHTYGSAVPIHSRDPTKFQVCSISRYRSQATC